MTTEALKNIDDELAIPEPVNDSDQAMSQSDEASSILELTQLVLVNEDKPSLKTGGGERI